MRSLSWVMASSADRIRPRVFARQRQSWTDAVHGGRADASAVAGGSIDGLGGRFWCFRIKDLELVDLTRGSWNQVTSWLQGLERLRRAA